MQENCCCRSVRQTRGLYGVGVWITNELLNISTEMIKLKFWLCGYVCCLICSYAFCRSLNSPSIEGAEAHSQETNEVNSFVGTNIFTHLNRNYLFNICRRKPKIDALTDTSIYYRQLIFVKPNYLHISLRNQNIVWFVRRI